MGEPEQIERSFAEAINDAIDLCLKRDPSVYLMGLGVPDPRGVFGSTAGLQQKYGSDRVLDMPVSENGMTGVAIGSAAVGLRPILTHQRIDFALLAMDQIVNQAANWHYMFGGRMSLPIVIRMIVGRGWGQGPQHSQSLQAWFAHVPGLKVVVPSNPYDAKGLLIASVRDENPVIFIEHRWLYPLRGPVPTEVYTVPIGRARVARPGADVSIVATSHMVTESLEAAERLSLQGASVEVIDVRTLRPLDEETIVASVRKTRRLVVADTGWTRGGVSAEIVATIAERGIDLAAPPRRVALPDCPSPTARALEEHFYPGVDQIVSAVMRCLGGRPARPAARPRERRPPETFTGPF